MESVIAASADKFEEGDFNVVRKFVLERPLSWIGFGRKLLPPGLTGAKETTSRVSNSRPTPHQCSPNFDIRTHASIRGPERHFGEVRTEFGRNRQIHLECQPTLAKSWATFRMWRVPAHFWPSSVEFRPTLANLGPTTPTADFVPTSTRLGLRGPNRFGQEAVPKSELCS